MGEIEKKLKDHNISMVDYDSIIDIPIWGEKTPEDSVYQEATSQVKKEKQFEKYLERKFVFSDFDLDDKQIDYFLAKNIDCITQSPNNLRIKLLIFENFKYLDQVFSSSEVFEYSNEYIYAAFCLRKRMMQEGQKAYSVDYILKAPKAFGYTKEKMMGQFPFDEKTLEKLEHIHAVKKDAKNKSAGSSL